MRSYVISVSLGTGCYRHIQLSKTATLYKLHEAILEAFEFVDKALKLNPYDPFPYLMKGILYNKLEKFDEANECFVEAFRLNPELINMMNELS